MLGLLLTLWSVGARAQDLPFEADDPDLDSWDHSYVYPLPDDEIQVYDKSIPLPEILRKISEPSPFFLQDENEGTQNFTICAGEFRLPLNDYVNSYLTYYTQTKPGTIRWLHKRAGMYEDLINAEIKRRNLPSELIYLCAVESAFNPRAYSPMKAAGLWQFIYGTGRRYGLNVNYWVDERYDPEKSTSAAMDYLTDLYQMFGDWHLAMASYNCGEDYVGRRLRKTKCDSYWCLVDNGALPSETSRYVPNIVAMAIIGHNPERYGFTNLKKLPGVRYSTVTVDDATDLRTVALCAGASKEEIEKLNPALLRFATPPGARYKVNIPWGRAEQFNRAYARLSHDEKLAFKRHKVEKGQSLQAISAGYGTSYKLTANINGLSENAKLREGQILIIPVPKDEKFNPHRRQAPVEPEEGSSGRSRKPRKHIYKIEPGDTLWGIAKVNNISVEDLKKWNPGLSENSLYAGDEIVIYSRSKPKTSRTDVPPPPSRKNSRTMNYKVREGDDCYTIARYYGIHSQHIIDKNHLDDKCTIQPGQQITLVVPKFAPTSLPPQSGERTPAAPQAPVPSINKVKKEQAGPKGTRKTAYTIQPGDSLWQIARDFDCHVEDILAWNGLEDDYMPQPGQTITMYYNPKAPPPKERLDQKPAAKTTPPTKPSASSSQEGSRGKAIRYTVKSGESLWLIARRHDVHVEEIVAWNGLDSQTVHEGQVLTIKPGPGYDPKAARSAPAPAAAAPPSSSSTSSTGKAVVRPKGAKKFTYTIVPGDSLWSVATAWNVNVTDLMAWNNLDDNCVLQVGQTLTIYAVKAPTKQAQPAVAKTPAKPEAPKQEVGPRGKAITYVVQEGDSLWGIAHKHDVYAWEIKQDNNMDSDVVRPGQKLKIRPGPGYKK